MYVGPDIPIAEPRALAGFLASLGFSRPPAYVEFRSTHGGDASSGEGKRLVTKKDDERDDSPEDSEKGN